LPKSSWACLKIHDWTPVLGTGFKLRPFMSLHKFSKSFIWLNSVACKRVQFYLKEALQHHKIMIPQVVQ
jgi:hypothetical protein